MISNSRRSAMTGQSSLASAVPPMPSRMAKSNIPGTPRRPETLAERAGQPRDVTLDAHPGEDVLVVLLPERPGLGQRGLERPSAAERLAVHRLSGVERSQHRRLVDAQPELATGGHVQLG